MGGFSADLKRKILGNTAHIVVDTTSQSPWGDYEPVLERVRAVRGVAAATPVDRGEVMASSMSNLAGVIVRGNADPSSIGNVIDLAQERRGAPAKSTTSSPTWRTRSSCAASRPTRSSASAPAARSTPRAPSYRPSATTSTPRCAAPCRVRRSDPGSSWAASSRRPSTSTWVTTSLSCHPSAISGRWGSCRGRANTASPPSSTAGCTSTTPRTST